jgi:hypothetical protein
MTLDASGQLGIGITSPSFKFHLYGTASPLRPTAEGTTNQVDWHSKNSGGDLYVGLDSSTGTISGTAYSAYMFAGNPVPMCFFTNSAERARIDSSGNLLVGTTTAYQSGKFVVSWNGDGGTGGVVLQNTGAGTAGQYAIQFFEQSTTRVGSIQTTGTATAYVTSSDYRLKENVAPMTGALATVAQLKPVTYTWKSTGSAGQGFIAHELKAVVPDCVTGEKDAIDADGNPDYQGIDTSFLVATLTAAIQELNAKFEAYKATHP